MAIINEARWKPGFRGASKLSAVLADTELQKIRKKNKGEAPSAAVVEAARSKRNKLHVLFDWDDASAAQTQREGQAGLIVRSIEVEYEEMPGEWHRKYEITRSEYNPREMVYKSVEDIMQDPEARVELLNRAMGELLAIRRRYSGLQELASIFGAIEAAASTV